MLCDIENYGDTREVIVIEKLSVLLDRKLYRTKFKYSSYDFYDDYGCVYELKSRTIPITQYKTSLIDIRKIKNNNYYSNIFLLYEYQNDNITDKKDLYFIKYDYELFNTFNIENNTTYNIPNTLLTKIDDKTNFSVFNPLKTTKLNIQFNKLLAMDYNAYKIYGSKIKN